CRDCGSGLCPGAYEREGQGGRCRPRRARNARSAPPARGQLLMAAHPPSRPAPLPRKANRRGAARLAAVQALYQMDVAGADLLSTLADFEGSRLAKEVEGERLIAADSGFFRELVTGVVSAQRRIDPIIHEVLIE